MNIDEILSNYEQLKKLLKKIPSTILAEEIASRPENGSLRQDGMYTLMVPNK